MLRTLVGTILLACMWMLLTARLSLESFLIGLVLGLAINILLSRSQEQAQRRSGIGGIAATLVYLVRLLYQTLAADLMVAWRIVKGDTAPDSGIVEVPVNSDDDVVAALSAHAITLTPGSFVVDFKDDNQTMIIHAIDKAMLPDLKQEQTQRAKLAERMVGHG